MKKYLKYISPAFFLISLFLILLFKSIPTSKIWKEYTVLYTPVESSESEIISVLKNTGISEIYSLSEQYLPISLPENSVEISMFKINRDRPEYNYYIRRNAFFFDKSNNFKLFYVPVEYKSKVLDVVTILNSKGIQAGIDSASSYPWIIAVIMFLLIIILSLFSKNKLVFVTSTIPVILYLINNPFYAAALANAGIVLSLFFISNIWRRKDFVFYLLNKYSIPAMVFISIVCGFSISLKSGFLFVCELFCIATYLYSYFSAEEFIRNRKSFTPVYIKSASMVSMFAKKTNIVMPVLISISVLFIGLFFISSSQSVGTHFSKLLLPSPSSAEAQDLPQLEDYYQWLWNIKSYPYRSLNSNNQDYIVEYKRFNNEGGFIEESRNLLAYNQNFKENAYAEIENLHFNAIEKVIKSEGENVKIGFSASKAYSTSFFSIIMMVLCVLVLLFIYFSIIIKQDAKK